MLMIAAVPSAVSAQTQNAQSSSPQSGDSATSLPTISVSAEQPDGAVTGYVANRSSTAGKTGASIL